MPERNGVMPLLDVGVMMRLIGFDVFPMRLPLRENFIIASRVAADAQVGGFHIYLRLRTEDGFEGWGEARPSPRWSYETPETVVTTLRHYFRPRLINGALGSIDSVHSALDGEIAPGPSMGQPIARCAVDVALHDLFSRRAGLSLSRYLGADDPAPQPLSCLVTGTTTEEYVQRTAMARSEGFSTFKLKIGKGVQADVDIINAVREVTPEATLWADANGAYRYAEAQALIRRIGGAVDFLEQPLTPDEWEGHARLSSWSPVPIALDESLFTPRSILQYLARGPLHALVLKLTRCGGIRPCIVSGWIAREAGATLLGSGLTDSRLGLAASSHAFQALGITIPVDLNGPQFIADGPVEACVPVEAGMALLPDGPGLGFEPNEDTLRKYIDPVWDRL